ncbi:MAG: biotin--[Clostridia bacterium]|nr:biotin--[acetyl-CoA-carboxylase] ligase [Clostridia bacterium]
GRGRKGRSFFSPDGTGIYMSLLLRPQIHAELALRITTVAAVSVCQAIEKLSSRKPGIKWVNDIYMDGRKVCGILTETALASGGRLEYAVLGIGVNALADGARHGKRKKKPAKKQRPAADPRRNRHRCGTFCRNTYQSTHGHALPLARQPLSCPRYPLAP